jgi:RecB family exonuclease
VRLLGAVAEYLAQGRFPSLASLVRHPDLPAQLLPSRAPALADEYFETHLPARLPRGRLAGEAGEDGLAELRKILDGPDFLGPLQGRRPLPEWMPRLLDFLIQVYGGAPLRPARPRDRAVLEALLRVREGAEALGRVPGPLVEMCAAPDAIQALLGELRDVRVPPEGEGESIELVGWLELHLDDAPVLILTGMNEPFLPESVNADPFLPNALRGRLGLEDNQARLARDVYRLTAILRSRPGTRLITGRRDASGDPLRPSRLLLTGDADTVAATLLRFAETEDPGRRSSSRLASGIRPPPASAFRLPPRERIALPQIPQPLSVTAFAPILRDPYGWVLEHVLRLRESCDDQQELDALAFGSLAHTVLERFAHTAEAESSDPVRVRTRLGRILDSVVKDLFGPSPLPAVPVQVEQLRARLGAFAAWQAGWVAQGWRIHAAEARTPKGGSPLDVDGRPVLLAGRVDRIDRNLVTGAWMVMDYKTGEGGADPGRARSRDGRWTDLQLPLYAFLLGDLCHRDGTPLAPPGPQASVGLAYLPISGGPGPVQLMVAEWTPADLDSALEAAREVIRGLRSRREVVFDPWVSGAAARGALAALLGVGLLDEEDSGE